MPLLRPKARYSPPKGPVAVHPSAYGEEFFVALVGGPPFEMVGERAVVCIDGPLDQHAGGFSESYDRIRENVAAAFNSEAKEVVLRIGSPGGDFAGSIELARELRAMSAAKGKPLICFTDSQALSAGYILACSAAEIVITPSAFVGSIGVWAPMVDETKADAAKGLTVAIVASGARKTDGNPHVAITEDGIAALQAQVDAMAALFFAFVQEARPMSPAGIVGLQGSQQFGLKAESLHLADRIVLSWGEYLSSTTSEASMAKSYGDTMAAHRAALEKCAEGTDEDAKAAQRDLKAWDEKEAAAKAAEEEENKKKEEGADASASAKADADGDKDGDASAKAEFPPKKEEDDKKAAARGGLRIVATATATEVDFAKRLHAIECERSDEKEAAERTALLATRPDFSAETRGVFGRASIEVLRDAVKNLPRGSNPAKAAAAALTPGGTRGDTQSGSDEPVDRNGMPRGFVGQSEEDFIDGAMRMKSATNPGVKATGRELTMGFMSKDEARASLAKLEAKQNGAGK